MKQSFNLQEHQDFQKYFQMKNSPSKIEKKFIEKTKQYIKYIKWIPGIRLILIGNSISMNCANKNSDIDLYIVTQKNRMWFVRILMTLVFQIMGVRKTAHKHAGQFCLSFFSTENGSDFRNFALKNDIYLYFWIVYAKPILSYNKAYEKFIEKNSSWADFSQYKDIIEKNKGFIQYSGKKRNSHNSLFNSIDHIFKKIFLTKTLKNYHKLGKPYGIQINDNLLKFHNNDKRKDIKKQLLS